MGFRYHVQSLARDVDYQLGYVTGGANIEVVRARIAEDGCTDAVLIKAVEQLGVYFDQIDKALGPGVRDLAERQELDAEILEGADARGVAMAEKAPVGTTITKREVLRLADVIDKRTRAWKD